MSLVDFLWVIPVFGLLIFIHELGHFVVAKYFNIRVHEFALGFGPVLVGFDKGETRYNLRAVPLGGFVRMAGMEESDDNDERGFNRKSVLARSLVIAAGPMMNFVLAALIASAMFYVFGGESDPTPILGKPPAVCTVQTGGATGAAQPCPAAVAGLQQGDRIVSINGTPVADWDDIYRLVRASNGQALTFQVQRGAIEKEIRVQPIQADGRWMVGIAQSHKKATLGQAIVQGPVTTVRVCGAWLRSTVEMVTGRLKPDLQGPVGITRTIAAEASQGIPSLLQLTFMLSINLGMFNLLPIPALDGSRLLFMLIEAIRGRRVDPQRENMVHFVGFLILIGLMVVITYGEVASLLKKG